MEYNVMHFGKAKRQEKYKINANILRIEQRNFRGHDHSIFKVEGQIDKEGTWATLLLLTME